jgi:hypothetical protein
VPALLPSGFAHLSKDHLLRVRLVRARIVTRCQALFRVAVVVLLLQSGPFHGSSVTSGRPRDLRVRVPFPIQRVHLCDIRLHHAVPASSLGGHPCHITGGSGSCVGAAECFCGPEERASRSRHRLSAAAVWARAELKATADLRLIGESKSEALLTEVYHLFKAYPFA